MGVYSCIQDVFRGVMRFCGTGICRTVAAAEEDAEEEDAEDSSSTRGKMS